MGLPDARVAGSFTLAYCLTGVNGFASHWLLIRINAAGGSLSIRWQRGDVIQEGWAESRTIGKAACGWYQLPGKNAPARQPR